MSNQTQQTQSTDNNGESKPVTAPPAALVPAQAVASVKRQPTDDPSAVNSLNAFASSGNFEIAQRMAKALSDSTLVPEAYRGSVSNCLIAIEMSSRIKASVFAVMQNMDIVYGRPSWRSSFLIATVNASGRFTPLRFRWQGKRGEPEWGCSAVARDRETGEECIGALITWSLANAEGWIGRKGSKWQTMPEQMFMYRASAFWTRVYAPELSLGMHSSDEVEDWESQPPLDVGPAAGGLEPIAHADNANSGRRMSLRPTSGGPIPASAQTITDTGKREPFPASDYQPPPKPKERKLDIQMEGGPPDVSLREPGSDDDDGGDDPTLDGQPGHPRRGG